MGVLGFGRGESVTIIRPGPRDRFGDATAATRRTVSGCGLDWSDSAEDAGMATGVGVGRSETLVARVRVFMPTGTDVTNHDLLELPDGSRWRVTGRPKRFHHPITGTEFPVEVTATIVTTDDQGGL